MKTPYWMQFLAPDGGEGGSGGAALESTISPAEPYDVRTYEPISIADLEAQINGPDAPEIEAPPAPKQKSPPPPKTPEAKPKTPPPAKQEAKTPPAAPETAPSELDPAKAPVNQLREAYVSTKAELETARKELEALRTDHPELKTAREELATMRKQAEEWKKAQDDYERKLALQSPAATKRMREMDAKFNEEMTERISEVPGLEPHYAKLVRDYARLPHGKPEYGDKLADFEQELIDLLGSERKADRALPLITRGLAHWREMAKTEQELRQDSGKFIFEQESKAWEADAQKFQADAEHLLDVDPDIATADPYHPTLYLQHCAKQAPEQFNDRRDKLLKVAQMAMMPPKPRTKNDFPGLTDEQIADTLKRQAQEHLEAKRVAIRLIVQGGLTQFFHRGFWEQYKKMEERAKSEATAEPSPRTAATASRPGAGSFIDPLSYEPPAVPDERDFQ